MAAHRYGPPSGTQAMEYVVGALAAFVVLVLVASRLPVEPQVAGPRGGLARYNITPIFVIAAVALLVRVLPIPALGFSLAGTMAAGGYAIAVSLADMYGRR